MFSSDDLRLLADVLHTTLTTPLTEAQQQALASLGAVAVLEELLGSSRDSESRTEASSEAARLLQETAEAHPLSAARAQAFAALARLAEGGILPAVDALYRLAVEGNHLAARQAVTTRGWQPSSEELAALLEWETSNTFPSGRLDSLTSAYFQEASPALQRRMIYSAPAKGLENWAAIVIALQEARVVRLVERYPAFGEEERELLLDRLQAQAATGDRAAQEALTRLYIEQEDPTARQIALANGYAPEDPERQALFLFLAGDWAQYENYDFNHNLLINAYERAPRPLRRRILDHSRYTGHIEWLRGLHDSGEPRWLEDLSDADWENAINRLDADGRYEELWRLAQSAPPAWSAPLLDRLAERAWQPEDTEARSGFHNLLHLARAALARPLELRPRNQFQAPERILTDLALAGEGSRLMAGSTENEILRWKLPDGTRTNPPLLLPVQQVRTITSSTDGSLLAAASGDHRIRIFRLPEGTLLKTLEGHQAQIRALVLHPDGHTLYSAGFDGSIRIWRFPTGPLRKTLSVEAGELFALAISAGGQRLYSGGSDGILRVWALPEAALAREIPAHTGMLTQLHASPNGDLVATAGRDGFLRIWNAGSGRLVRAITCLQPVTALALHPDENVLASGHNDGTLTIWNISTGRSLGSYAAQNSPITSMLFSQSGDILYSAAGNSVRVWNLTTFLTLRMQAPLRVPGNLNVLGDMNGVAGARSAGETAEQVWVEFASELARWHSRHDIELEETPLIPVGEFDIEL